MERQQMRRVLGNAAAAISISLALTACSSAPSVQSNPAFPGAGLENKRYSVDENGVRVFKADIAEMKRLSIEGWPDISNGPIVQSNLAVEQKAEVVSTITTIVAGIGQCAPPFRILTVERFEAVSGEQKELWTTDTCGKIRWRLEVENERVKIHMLGD